MTAGTAGRPCCRADRAESRSPPPPPRPAQRLHAAEKQQVKIKIFLIVTFLINISHYSRIKFQKIYYLPLGTRPLSSAGTTGRWWAARRSASWSLVPGSRTTGARPGSRAGQQRSRSPETAGDSGTRRSSRSPQVGGERRADGSTGTTGEKKKLIKVQLFKNTDLSRFPPTPKFNYNFQVRNLKTWLIYWTNTTTMVFFTKKQNLNIKNYV